MNKAQLMQRRHQLTVDNLYLGRHIARKYVGRLDLDTLFSIANEKLFECTETYDENQGKVGTYAGRPIRREIRREIVRQRSMGMTNFPNLADEYPKIRIAERYLLHELKRPPKDEELLEHLKLQARSEDTDCTVTQRHIQAYKMMTNGKVALASLFYNPGRYHQLERLAQNEEISQIMGILNNGVLTDKEKAAVKLYFGLGHENVPYGDNRNFREIAESIGVKKQRAEQLVKAALEKMRDKMTLEQKDTKNQNNPILTEKERIVARLYFGLGYKDVPAGDFKDHREIAKIIKIDPRTAEALTNRILSEFDKKGIDLEDTEKLNLLC